MITLAIPQGTWLHNAARQALDLYIANMGLEPVRFEFNQTLVTVDRNTDTVDDVIEQYFQNTARKLEAQ